MNRIERTLALIPWIAAVLLGWRLFNLINRYSVDALFCDEFGYYPAIAHQRNWWALFDWQLGPHRMGIGLIVSKYIAEVTGWNIRAEAFFIGGIICAATAATLLLKKRLFGRLAWYDMAIPFFMLTPVQYDIWAGTPNSSHGAWPLFLVIGSCWAWTVRRQAVRYPLVVALNFLAVFTGFGVFMGVITPGLLILDLVGSWRRRNRGASWFQIGALVLVLGTAGLFFVGYVPNSSVPNFRFPDPHWYLYPHVMALSLARTAGGHGWGMAASVLGWSLLIATIAILAAHLRWFDEADPSLPLRRTILLLVGFSFVFGADMAIGRISLGYFQAQASRYTPLLMPGLIGIYFATLRLRPPPLRCACIGIMMAISIYSGLRVKQYDRYWMNWYADGKKRWLAAYQQTHDFRLADQISNYQIDPAYKAQHVPAIFNYMRQHRLNIFRDSPPQ